MCVGNRKEMCKFDITPLEHRLEDSIRTELNWAIAGQKHSHTSPHVDTAGVFTLVGVLSGIKLWAIRKTALYGNREMDVDNVEYFVDLIARDFDGIPIEDRGEDSDSERRRIIDEALGLIPGYKGQEDAWFATLLFPGDILCAKSDR